ncbi:MAG: hypothetical protein HY791_30805 [Deltaproteobacteria bacterium]|nr:hypothetical protein [Deltaproteobacteria bacterium]
MTTGQPDALAPPGLSAGDPAPEPHSFGPHKSYESPLSSLISETLLAMMRAGKALRVYDPNNQMLTQQLERAQQHLDRVLEATPEFTLTVREDRLKHEHDDVHVDSDREAGLPFVFYRNAFRRLTFVRGFTLEELRSLLTAINTDFGSIANAGEDLVTALWRMALPHLRYLTIDALSVAVETTTEVGKKEARELGRLQGEVDQLVAKIYNSHNADVADEDLVKGASITKEDLEALKGIREESKEDLDLLDAATERRIIAIDDVDLLTFHAELSANTDLQAELLGILLELLYGSRTSAEAIRGLDLLEKLFETMLVGGRFDQATQLVTTLRSRAENQDIDLKVVHISRMLMTFLAKPTRIAPAVEALNDPKRTRGTQEIVDFIRSLGSSVVPGLISALDEIESAPHRRTISELIVELGLPRGSVLLERARAAKEPVLRDILSIAAHLPIEERATTVLFAVQHPSPKIRLAALTMLKAYPRGLADELIAKAIEDDDFELRLSAYRLAGGRQSAAAKPMIERRFRAEDFWDLDTRELRGLTLAYAMITGPASVPVLDSLLSPGGGVFGRSRMTEGQAAAAHALGYIASDEAIEAIKRGARTLNTKLRDACKRAFDAAVATRLKKGRGDDADVETFSVPTGPDVLRAASTGAVIVETTAAPRSLERPIGLFHRTMRLREEAEVMPQNMPHMATDGRIEVPSAALLVSEASSASELPSDSLELTEVEPALVQPLDEADLAPGDVSIDVDDLSDLSGPSVRSSPSGLELEERGLAREVPGRRPELEMDLGLSVEARPAPEAPAEGVLPSLEALDSFAFTPLKPVEAPVPEAELAAQPAESWNQTWSPPVQGGWAPPTPSPIQAAAAQGGWAPPTPPPAQPSAAQGGWAPPTPLPAQAPAAQGGWAPPTPPPAQGPATQGGWAPPTPSPVHAQGVWAAPTPGPAQAQGGWAPPGAPGGWTSPQTAWAQPEPPARPQPTAQPAWRGPSSTDTPEAWPAPEAPKPAAWPPPPAGPAQPVTATLPAWAPAPPVAPSPQPAWPQAAPAAWSPPATTPPWSQPARGPWAPAQPAWPSPQPPQNYPTHRDPNPAPTWDQNSAAYAQQQPNWDPNPATYAQPQTWDPNAAAYAQQPQTWDPNYAQQPPNWDPNAAAYAQQPQNWDPNAAPYGQQPQNWDSTRGAQTQNRPAPDPSATGNFPPPGPAPNPNWNAPVPPVAPAAPAWPSPRPAQTAAWPPPATPPPQPWAAGANMTPAAWDAPPPLGPQTVPSQPDAPPPGAAPRKK